MFDLPRTSFGDLAESLLLDVWHSLQLAPCLNAIESLQPGQTPREMLEA